MSWKKESGKATKCTRAFSVVIVAAMVLGGFLGVVSTIGSMNAKAATTTLYDESTSGWTLSGLWHQTSYRKYSGSYSLAYNQESTHNFDTGATNSGDAISPSLALGSSGSLTFWSWYQTEDTGTSYDKKLVYISTNGGSTWTQIYQVSGTASTWVQITVSLSSYAGSTVKFKFRFDTVDSLYNNYEGWYVDSVVVTDGGATNTAPTAAFTCTTSDLTVNVDASSSSDAQDPASSLQVRWDWTNDGTYDTSFTTTKTASYNYPKSGTYTIKLEVKDTGGLTGTTTKSTTVGINHGKVIVSVEWDADSTYLNTIAKAVRHMYNHLWDYGDGCFVISSVEIYEGKTNWDSANIQVHNVANFGVSYGSAPAYADAVGYDYKFHLAKTTWNGEAWDSERGADVMSHEWAHARWGLYDEYYVSTGANGQCPCIMNFAYTAEELCYSGNHVSDVTSTDCWTLLDNHWPSITYPTSGPLAGPTDDVGSTLSVTIIPINSPPNTPSTPSGTTSGKTGTSYTYTTSTTDPNGDNVKYTFDWGDGTTTTTGFYASGATASASHSWSSAGTYYVKVYATDSNGASSGWSGSLTVTITTATTTIFSDNIASLSGWTISTNQAGGTTTIFSDSIASLSSWTISTNQAGYQWSLSSARYYSASYSARTTSSGNYPNSLDTYMTRSVSLGSYTSATLTFYIWQYTESGYDYVQVQYYNGAWTTAWSRSGSYQSWGQISVSIPTSATQIRFRFYSDSSVVYEGAYIDNVVLTGQTSGDSWALSSARYYSASYSAKCTKNGQYPNSLDTSMTRSVSLSGYSSATLTFYIWQYTESGYDYIQVQYYSGGTWTTAWSRSGSYQSWSQISVNIPTSTTQIRFRFYSDSSVVYEGAYIDNVVLTAS